MRRLFLFDYDGPCVRPGIITHDSLREVGNNILIALEKEPLTDQAWSKIFAETSGTTELNTIKVIAKQAGILTDDGEPQPRFINSFLYFREQYLTDALTTLPDIPEEEIDPEDLDQMYEDLPFFVENATTEEDLIWLGTGNPRSTMHQRLKFLPKLEKIFLQNGKLHGAFGDEAYSRPELLQLAIERAVAEGYIPTYDELGWMNNVYYIGDAKMDFKAALETRVRHILVPRVIPHEFAVEEATGYGRVAGVWTMSEYPRYRGMMRGITTFDENGPRVIYSSSLYNPYLLLFTRPDLDWTSEEAHELIETFDIKVREQEIRTKNRRCQLNEEEAEGRYL